VAGKFFEGVPKVLKKKKKKKKQKSKKKFLFAQTPPPPPHTPGPKWLYDVLLNFSFHCDGKG